MYSKKSKKDPIFSELSEIEKTLFIDLLFALSTDSNIDNVLAEIKKLPNKSSILNAVVDKEVACELKIEQKTVIFKAHEGATPLFCAFDRRKVENIVKLISAGINITQYQLAFSIIIDAWKEKKKTTPPLNFIALQLSIYFEDLQSFEIYLAKIKQLEINEGVSPLYLVLSLDNPKDPQNLKNRYTIFTTLTEKFAIQLNQRFYKVPNVLAALICLPLNQNLSIQLLDYYEQKGQLNLKNDPSAAYWAAESGKIAVFNYLVSKLEDIDKPMPDGTEKTGNQLVAGCCLFENTQITELMLAVLQKKTGTDKLKANADSLETVVQHCSVEIVELFFKYTDADPDYHTDKDYEAGLLTAALHNPDRRVFELLCSKSQFPLGDINTPEPIQKIRLNTFLILLRREESDSLKYAFGFLEKARLPLGLTFETLVYYQSEKMVTPVNLFYFLLSQGYSSFIDKYLDTFGYTDEYIKPITHGICAGFSLLPAAILFEEIETVKKLLKYPQIRSFLNTPMKVGYLGDLSFLEFAYRVNALKIMELLIKHGARADLIIAEHQPLILKIIIDGNIAAFKIAIRTINLKTICELNKSKASWQKFLQAACEIIGNRECYLKIIESHSTFLPNTFLPPNLQSHSIFEHSRPNIPEVVEQVPAYSNSVVFSTLIRKPNIHILIHHAYYLAKNIEKITNNTDGALFKSHYYLLSLYILRLAEVLYIYAKQNEDSPYISKKDAFRVRNTIAHFYHELTESKIRELAILVCVHVLPYLEQTMDDNLKQLKPSTKEHYPSVVDINRTENLLDSSMIKQKLVQEIQSIYKSIEDITQLNWFLNSQSRFDEVIMRLAVIGQYARLLRDRNEFTDLTTSILVKDWLNGCIKIRNIISHEISEETTEAELLLPKGISKSLLFSMIEILQCSKKSFIKLGEESINIEARPSFSLTDTR